MVNRLGLTTSRPELQMLHHLLRLLAAGSLLAPAILFAFIAWQRYEETFHHAEEHAKHTARLLEEHAAKTFETLELILRLADQHLRGVSWEEIRTSRELWDELRRLQQTAEQVGSIFVIDGAGRNALTTRSYGAGAVDFSDRDYFVAQQNEDAGVYLGQAYIGRISKRPIFNLSIRRSSLDGSFDGVIGSSAFTDYFETFYARAGVADDDFAIALVRDDGRTLVSFPSSGSERLATAREEFGKQLASGASLIRARSSEDGVERLYANRKVSGRPAYVAYGVSRPVLIGAWLRGLVWWGLGLAGVAVALLLTCGFALRLAKSEAAAMEQLRRASNEALEQREARERAEAAMRQAQKLEALGQFTGGIAHDFNNLLSVVLSNLHLLHKHFRGEPRERTLMDGAIQAAERGAALTKRLLAFARRQELAPRAVFLADLVAGMEDLIRRSVGPQVRVSTKIPGLPPAYCDPGELELALLNLVVNARDAMPFGGALSISARAEQVGPGDNRGLEEGAYVCVAVRDTGIGMDASTLARAAEPFFTTKGVDKGTGLGLSMVHGFAAQTGGALRLHSAPGVGTTAELWLPQSQGQAAAAPEPALAASPVATPPCTILVVEDDFLVAEGIVAMLEDLGHTVLAVASGEQALGVLDKNRSIDLVLTDQSMPNMTGVQLARRVRERWPGVPILLASGYSELPKDAPAELSRLGKPFTQAMLAESIAGLFARQRGKSSAA
jgi:signal transduction histidine kinase